MRRLKSGPAAVSVLLTSVLMLMYRVRSSTEVFVETYDCVATEHADIAPRMHRPATTAHSPRAGPLAYI